MNAATESFDRTESHSAGLLLAATVVALVWANSPVGDAYEDLWHTQLAIGPGGVRVAEDLGHWVSEGLMAVFFYLVGLEIRHELSLGDLRDRRAAAIPAIAALAGMVVPALIYTAVNAGGAGAHGWGIPMATDIAFVLGLVALLGSRCPPGVRIFLLTLAIVDDIGAVAVIAVFYSGSIDVLALAGAAGVLALVALGQRMRDWGGPAYALAALALWLLTYASGVHPTIAGVALGLVTAVHAPRGGGASPNERFQRAVHPWSSYLIVPLFALANAGVALGGDALSRAATSPITIGVVVALVAGKAFGISLVSLAGVRSGLGRLPRGMGSGHLLAASSLAGVGFTVSLFVADLAFTSEVLREEAKVGVLAGSVVAAGLGWGLFRVIDARRSIQSGP